MYNPSDDEVKKASGIYKGFGFEDKVVRKVVEEPCTETLHKMVDHAANPPMLESEWSDEVNTPAHYVKDGIECIDAIKGSMTVEEFKGYLKGNVMKYMWRYQDKEKSLQDLKKGQWYLERLIKEVRDCKLKGPVTSS
jgi:hypothetical protein